MARASERQHTFQVTVVVKGDDREQAERELTSRLMDWFKEDWAAVLPRHGYPTGSLLWYMIAGPQPTFEQGKKLHVEATGYHG